VEAKALERFFVGLFGDKQATRLWVFLKN
jgi:hypothetical protein